MSYARSLLWGCDSAQKHFLRLCEILVSVAGAGVGKETEKSTETQ